MSVSIECAAELLGRCRRTVYNRIKSGHLTTIRVGLSSRVTIESLKRQPELVDRQSALDHLLARAFVPHPNRAA
jgi:excisionase family DNA binding protein